jgi:hypothetical protein
MKTRMASSASRLCQRPRHPRRLHSWPPTTGCPNSPEEAAYGPLHELRLPQVLSERVGTQIEAAGDDRQSIYGFRPADALALHKFPEVYGLAEVDYLFRSKRCPRAVCDFADAVAENRYFPRRL